MSSLRDRPRYFDPSYVKVLQRTNLDTVYLVDVSVTLCFGLFCSEVNNIKMCLCLRSNVFICGTVVVISVISPK